MSPTRSLALALSALLTLAPPFGSYALASNLTPAKAATVKIVRAKHKRAVSFNASARRMGIVAMAKLSSPPPLTLRAGLPAAWEPSMPVYGGVASLATGNLTLTRQVTGWSALGPGVGFTLYANSSGTPSVGLGPNWRHSYSTSLATSGSNVILKRADGREVVFTGSGGAYTVEAGYDEKLATNSGGGWTLTHKGGSTTVFDASGRLISQADADGNATTLTYSNGLLTTVTDAAGRALTLTYASGNILSVTDPEGRVWGFVYSGGRLQKVNDPSLNGQIFGTAYDYDGDGRVASMTDRLNKTWTYAYGTAGNFLYVSDPAGNSAGQSTGSTGPTDPYPSQPGPGHQSAPTSPDSIQSTYPAGTVANVYVEDAAGNPAEYGMDASGRVTGKRDGLGNQTNLQYDAKSNVTEQVAPDGKTTTFAYDVRRNLTSSTDPTNRTTTQTYDADDNLLTRTNAAGTMTNTFDAERHLLTTTDPTNRTTSCSYNANGRMASTTDPAGKTTTYGYDAVGNLNLVTDPLNNATSYVYALDRVVSRTDERSRTTTYTYDAWRRVTAVDYPASTDQSFTYDVEGRLTASTDGTGSRTYTYNDLGYKIAQTDPRGNTSATYDAVGRLTSQTDVAGRLVEYSHDARGLMTGMSDSTSSASYTYDANGRVLTTTYHNGMVSTYGYDDAGRMISLVHRQGRFTTIASYGSTYDASGRLSQVSEGGQGGNATITYGYDAAGHLTSEDRTGANPYVSTYTYNSRGLRQTAYRSENGTVSHNGTYTYDDAGRLTNVADAVTSSGLGGSYTWNADGTLASYPGPGYRRNLEYDEEKRLISIKKGIVLAYEYAYGFDGGRRWRKDVANNIWDWYPCGVACCAGELVSLRSTSSGATWSISKRALRGETAQIVDGVPYLQRVGSVAQPQGLNSQPDSFGLDRQAGKIAARSSLRVTDDESVLTVLVALQQPAKPPKRIPVFRPRPSPTIVHSRLPGVAGCVDNQAKIAAGLYPGAGSYDNAMRHCVGSCKAAKTCGGNVAAIAGHVKEFSDQAEEIIGIEHGHDSNIDDHNNKEGIAAGLTGTPDCARACHILYWNLTLKW